MANVLRLRVHLCVCVFSVFPSQNSLLITFIHTITKKIANEFSNEINQYKAAGWVEQVISASLCVCKRVYRSKRGWYWVAGGEILSSNSSLNASLIMCQRICGSLSLPDNIYLSSCFKALFKPVAQLQITTDENLREAAVHSTLAHGHFMMKHTSNVLLWCGCNFRYASLNKARADSLRFRVCIWFGNACIVKL